jgi:hypothetical protein
MRLTSTAVEVPLDEGLVSILADLFAKTPRIKAVIETGTYQGTGTTQIVIEAVKKMFKEHPKISKKPAAYTIEASEKNYLIAKNNLKQHDWITVIHGCSLDLGDCKKFIEEDDAILHHEDYPDIFIDSHEPVDFYTKEIAGQLFGKGGVGTDNVLARLIPDIWKMRPLFILDSAGGVGWKEFQTVVELMQDRLYYVFADDCAHLKHFRTKAYMKHCQWPILAEDSNGRWILAQHPGRTGNPNW